jgi:deoxyhypusine synthase
MHKEQKEKGTIFSPSKIIRRIGQKINNKESIYYWCAKNDIPVYCPAFTDGALGDVVYF